MKVFFAILLIAVTYSQAQVFRKCERNFKKVGCYSRNKALLPTMLLNGREFKKGYLPESGLISWGDYVNYLHSLACECADKAKSSNLKFFGIGFYGECFGGNNMIEFANLKSSKAANKCVSGSYSVCEGTDGDHECAGQANAEYIYILDSPTESDTEVINGGLGEWSDWTECDQTCGEGIQVRERSCNNPLPQNGGADCEELGSLTEQKSCNVRECPVNGGYSRWSEFSECTRSCDGGIQKRTRTCTNPPPMHGGNVCEGPAEETQNCGTDPCPVDGGFTDWSEYGQCTVTCGGGTQIRERSCTNPAPQNGGNICNGLTEETRKCATNSCPVDGEWTAWSSYGQCSKQCGQGTMERTRSCSNPSPVHGGKSCAGNPKESKSCMIKQCPVNGGWSSWSSYGSCSKTCNYGSKTRTRTCTNPSPKHNGANCPGLSRQTVNCNVGVRCPYYTAYHSNHVCEGGSMRMWCTDKQQKIKLSEYWYGRTERHTCGGFFKYVWSTSCKFNKPSKVWRECQDKSSCEVKANNDWMGKDPCWGTHKYFQVKFRCYG